MNPFVFGFYTARAFVLPHVILKRPEADKRFFLVRRLISQAAGGDKLPALEINMGFQILFPRGLHRRFEGQHQHFAPPHFLGELIGGKGLAEAHFCVP